MTKIIGITDGDDAGAALIVDGRMVAAVNEERLNRMKMSIGFPWLAIQEVLRLGGVTPQGVDYVAMAAHTEKFNYKSLPNKGWFHEPSAIARIRNEISALLAKQLGQYLFAHKLHYRLKRLTMGRRRPKVRQALRELGLNAPISYHEHHRCHAIAAFAGSGFDDAISISLDGGGDGCSSHVYVFNGKGEKLINRLSSFDSIGNYYAYVTHLCGYRASIHEGKITGLSASGKSIYKDLFNRLIDFDEGQIRNCGKLFFSSAINYLRHTLPHDWEHRDLAASIQQQLEDVAVKYVHYWMDKSGKRKICLSGGVFANVIMNQRIAELPDCDEVYVFPAMGDGGLAAGAAFSRLRELGIGSQEATLGFGTQIPHFYLGPSYSDDEIELALKKSGLSYKRFENIEEIVAQLVYEGKVVARFNGPMEYGPRALGNRTILYKTDDPSVNAWLNKRLRRTEFMPFAPACLAGHEEQLFHWNKASKPSAPYMNITLDCTEWMKEHCPAVVHVDGTARPQIVDSKTNPSFYHIIKHYYELSGVPVVVNTSFNMHEEPIVCSPEDAIRSYSQGQLDNLAIGNFLLGDVPRSKN